VKLSNTSQKFLEELAAQLKEMGFSPVILRNYEELPVEIGNDLDIFVPKEDLRASAVLLLKLVKEFGGKLGHVHERDYFHALWFRFEDEKKYWHVDLYPGALCWHGLPILSKERFLGQLVTEGPWSVPRPAHEAVLIFLIGILWGGALKSSYWKKIDLLLKNPSESLEFIDCLKDRFGEVGEGVGEKVFHRDLNDQDLMLLAKKLRRALKMKSLGRSPFISAIGWIKHWLGELRNYFVVPPGVVWIRSDLDEYESMEAIEKSVSGVRCFFGGVIVVSPTRINLFERIVEWLKVFKGLGQNRLVIKKGQVDQLDGVAVPKSWNCSIRMMDDIGKILQLKMGRDGYDQDA
jgi:hypothetical protein